jgi:hypothetical protein
MMGKSVKVLLILAFCIVSGIVPQAKADELSDLSQMLNYVETHFWRGITAAPTSAPATTTKAPTAPKTTTAAVADATTAAPAATTAEAKSGCGSTVALSALALVPMLGAAVVFGKKRED